MVPPNRGDVLTASTRALSADDSPPAEPQWVFVAYARGLIDHLRQRQLDVAPLLALAGLDEAALDQPARTLPATTYARLWAEAERLHGGRPFWAPYSRALAEWRLGRRDAAVASWQQAVEGLPVLGTEAGLLGRTAYWPGEQFETVRAVFGAWREQHEGAAAR